MIGYLLQDELKLLNKTEFKPVLQDIKDDGDKIQFVFKVVDNIITLTHSDTSIINYDPLVSSFTNLPRDQFVKKIWTVVKSDFITPRKDQEEIDFSVTLAPETESEINRIATFMLKPDTYALLDASFVLARHAPIIAYNIIKLIVQKAKNLKKIVPCDLLYALYRPNKYLNPLQILKQDNLNILLDTGDVVNV